MTQIIKGHTACPECGDTQAVKYDGRKFYISCTHCRTFTSYQSKTAKARIEARLTPVEEQEKALEPPPVIVEGSPDIKTNDQPYKPVRTKSFLESLNEFL